MAIKKSELYSMLWKSCDELRGGMDASQYKDYVGLCKRVEVKNSRNKKAIFGLLTILLREKNSVYKNGFKGYLFLIQEVRKQLIELATGMKVYGVSKKNFGQYYYLFHQNLSKPPLPKSLPSMDDEITQLEVERDKYKQIKAGMMQQLLTGKIRLVN